MASGTRKYTVTDVTDKYIRYGNHPYISVLKGFKGRLREW